MDVGAAAITARHSRHCLLDGHQIRRLDRMGLLLAALQRDQRAGRADEFPQGFGRFQRSLDFATVNQ